VGVSFGRVSARRIDGRLISCTGLPRRHHSRFELERAVFLHAEILAHLI
jgi:hypothetical protein